MLLLTALWARVVQYLEECAAQHADVLVASCEQRAAFHESVCALKAFFYADGRGVRPVDAAAGAATADACVEMLGLDRGALAELAADTTDATSPAQRRAAAFLLAHHRPAAPAAAPPPALAPPDTERQGKRRFGLARHTP